MFCIEDFSKKRIDAINKIWLAIMKMDTQKLSELLDDAIDYEDIGKGKFVEKLNARFQLHHTWGDEELLMDLDVCLGCKNNEPVCRFVGKNSGYNFALYFEVCQEQILDIYHCNCFKNKKK